MYPDSKQCIGEPLQDWCKLGLSGRCQTMDQFLIHKQKWDSDLMEAYDLYVALDFLQHYLTHVLITYQQVYTIYVCCDNKDVLDRINNVIPLCLNPNQTVSDKTSDDAIPAISASPSLQSPERTSRLKQLQTTPTH